MGDLQSFQEEKPHPRIPPRRGPGRADSCTFPCSCWLYLGAQTLLRRRQSHIRPQHFHASSAANESGVRRHSDDFILVSTDGAALPAERAAADVGAELRRLHPAAGEDLRRLVVSGQAAGDSSEHGAHQQMPTVCAGGGVGAALPQIPLYLSSSRIRFFQIF